MREGVCIKEKKVKSDYKIDDNVRYNRARRRWRKASYFSEPNKQNYSLRAKLL